MANKSKNSEVAVKATENGSQEMLLLCTPGFQAQLTDLHEVSLTLHSTTACQL